jgi:hypothetical protein
MSRVDERRQQRLAADAARLRTRAEQTSDERSRKRLLRGAARLERAQRWQRIYPFSVWLWGACVVLVLLPWALLTRYAHAEGWGIVASCLTALVLYVIARSRRER